MPQTPLETIARALAKVAATVTTGEPMAHHTTFRIGGPADVFAVVRTAGELVRAVNLCREHRVPFFLLGAGSNILVADAGIRGVVIRNKSAGLSLDGERAAVDSGYPMPKFAVEMANRGLSGAEFLQSIPGTMGGGARQNVRFRCAGQFARYDGLRESGETDCYLGQIVAEVEVLTHRGERKTLSNSECGFSYTGIHASQLAKESVNGLEEDAPIIIRLHLQLRQDSAGAVRERLQQYRDWRAHREIGLDGARIAQPTDRFTGAHARQPGGATAGCVFFNVPNAHNHPTGRLIDLCGLKGRRIGNAEISPLHANYIVNLGGAKATDVRALMDLAREKVFARFGVELVEEVESVGAW